MRSMLLFFALVLALPALAEVSGEEIRYTVDGKNFIGYLARDASIRTPRPGVIVVHEWWGHNAYARQRANMLAAEGYVALALDMYGEARHTLDPQQAQAMMQMAVGEEGAIGRRFQAALRELVLHPAVDRTRTAAIGYCFGGGVVLNMARAGAPLRGVVSFHGSLEPRVSIDTKARHPKVMVFNGEADPFVKPEQVTAFKQEMAEGGIDLRYVGYSGVLHSFTNPGANAIGERHGLPLRYDEHADRDSWERTLLFLSEVFWR